MQSPVGVLVSPTAAMVSPSQVAHWDPHQTNSFVVSMDSTIKMYRWSPKPNRIELLAAQSDVSHIKCMDWSPHPLYPDLIAIGHTTGNVELIRMGDTAILASQSAGSPSKVTLTSMGTQHSRACLSISFSPLAPAYLAAGFEKSRGQYSLHVWDIERVAKTLTGLAPRAGDPAVAMYQPRGSLQPDDGADWTGSAGPSRHPQSRSLSSAASAASDGSGSIRRYAFGEAVISVAFLPDHSHILCVGTGLRSLRLYDIRQSRESATDVETLAVHGICFDPFDSTRMASFGEDGVVEFWDTRKMPKPVLSLHAAIAENNIPYGKRTLSHIAFSPVRRGLFGTLVHESRYVRLWTLMGPTVEASPAETAVPTARPTSTTEDASDYTTAKVEADPTSNFPLIVGDMRSGRKLPREISHFVFIPSLDGTYDHDFILTTSKDRGVDIWRSPLAPVHVWSAQGELATASGASYRLAPDQSLLPEASNLDPWSLEIERISPAKAPQAHASELAASQLNDQSENAETWTKAAEDDSRVGRIPFPVTESGSGALSRQSSLSASRKLFASRQQSHTPTRQRSPPRGIQRPRQLALNDSKPRKPPDTRPLVVSGSLRASSSRPFGEMAKVMRTDISEIMKARVLCGYGVDSMTHNARVISRSPTPGVDTLPELWLWLESSNHFPDVKPSRVYGFDFTYQGMLSIWEGFSPMLSRPFPLDDSGSVAESPMSLGMSRSTSGRGHRHQLSRARPGIDPARLQYELAVEVMTLRRSGGVRKELPKAAVNSHRPTRRQYALGLCDWDLNDAEFNAQIQQWEEDRFTERAACWAVFLQNVPLAIEILLRSRDESLVMLSGTIQLLLEEQKSNDVAARPSTWRDHVGRLMVRLGGVYTRAMLSILVGETWIDLLVSETTLPLRERLAIALLFLPDEELSKYFRSLMEDMNRSGDINALLITGLNPAGLDVLQAFVDTTCDIQTAASLASFVPSTRWKSERRPKDLRPERWTEAYRNLLDSWKFFHHRVQFDLLRGEMNASAIRDGEVAPFEWVPRQMEVRCNYCNKLVNSQQPMEPIPAGAASVERVRAEFCPNCRRKLPRCAVCLFTVGMVNEDEREASLAMATTPTDTSDEAMVFCQACRHGGHSAHILDWFFGGVDGRIHSQCPVADCDCRCTEYF